jgi:hypothetical protein
MMLKLIRNRAGLVLAGLIAALCPMLMAPSGGFPSSPTFQNVVVQNSSGTNLDICNTSGAANNKCFNLRAGGSGTSFAISLENDAHVLGTNGLVISRNAGLSTLATVAIGDGTDKPAVTVNGSTLPRFAYGVINGLGGCSVVAGSSTIPTASNVSSCSRTSAGVYVVTLSGFTTAPACSFGSYTGNVAQTYSATGANTLAMSTFNTASAATDSQFSILCMGL